MGRVKRISRSSAGWLARQRKDLFVKKSRQEGYRSRAAYKLLELNSKHHFLHRGAKVIDLGAAPGSWSQVASEVIFAADSKINLGRVISIDILPIDPIKNVDIITGDLNSKVTLDQIFNLILLPETKITPKVDVVLSDLAPNLSGIWAIDLPQSLHLANIVMDLVKVLLKKNGVLLIKLFNGSGTEEYIKMLKSSFLAVNICKPKSSRLESREIYVLAKGYNLT